MLNWLKKNKITKPTESQQVEPAAPFEILLPDELMKSEVPDLRIASKFLSLLVESQLPSQHLEVFDGMPLINSPYPPIKQLLTTVNGAKQLKNFIFQVESMSFKSRSPDSKGSLCCMVNGVFTEFEISERAQNATINWEITLHVGKAT